jgi:hypothetical protein
MSNSNFLEFALKQTFNLNIVLPETLTACCKNIFFKKLELTNETIVIGPYVDHVIGLYELSENVSLNGVSVYRQLTARNNRIVGQFEQLFEPIHLYIYQVCFVDHLGPSEMMDRSD